MMRNNLCGSKILPMAVIREGMTRGIITHLSMLRNNCPRKPTYNCASLLLHGFSRLSLRPIPRAIPKIGRVRLK